VGPVLGLNIGLVEGKVGAEDGAKVAETKTN
jgi:hypothetical protein